METIDPRPDHDEAAASLAAVANAERAVRDRPWPIWLYPTNALLLGAAALTPLLGSRSLGALVALALVLLLLNYWAGHLIGTPFAIPTSRGFLIAVAAATVFLAIAMGAGASGTPWLIVGCAAAAGISYGVGSILHYRSTHE